MHERVRKELWGYGAEENLDAAQLHKIKYQVTVLYYLVFITLWICCNVLMKIVEECKKRI